MNCPNAFAVSLALALVAAPTSSLRAGELILDLTQPPPELYTASEAAVASLDRFLTALATQPEGISDFALRAGLPHAGGTEHIWLVDIHGLPDGQFRGVLADPPRHLDASAGDHMTFARETVSDWMFWRHGKIEGAYTLRALLPRMPDDDAALMRTLLAPLP